MEIEEALKNVGRRCTAIRKSKGLSRTKVCDEIGLNYVTLFKIESGTMKRGTAFATILYLANYYGVSVGYLVGEVG